MARWSCELFYSYDLIGLHHQQRFYRAIETYIKLRLVRSVGYPRYGHPNCLWRSRLSFSVSAQDAARFRFTALRTEGLVETARGGSGLTLKLTKADSSIVSTDHAHRGVELELAAFSNAIRGVDNGLGTPSSALKDVGLLQAAFESQGKPDDLQELVPEL